MLFLPTLDPVILKGMGRIVSDQPQEEPSPKNRRSSTQRPLQRCGHKPWQGIGALMVAFFRRLLHGSVSLHLLDLSAAEFFGTRMRLSKHCTKMIMNV